jgi:cytochrome P450
VIGAIVDGAPIIRVSWDILLDHHSAEWAAHSTEIYKDLRSRCPVPHSTAYDGFWIFTKYDDVRQVALDEKTFSNAHIEGTPLKGSNIPAPMSGSMGMASMIQDRHIAVRRETNKWFSQETLQRLLPSIREDTTRAIDSFIETGQCDLTNDLASVIPAGLTIRLLGLPIEYTDRYADAMHRGVYVGPGSPEREEVEKEIHWVVDTIREAVVGRRAKPTDDMCSHMANLEIDGELLGLDDAVGQVLLLVSGGMDTTSALLSHALLWLSQHPAEREWLAADQARMRPAADEFVRFFSPVQMLARTTTQDCAVHGTPLSKDSRVMISWASGNRDEEQFEDADQVRLDRSPNRHVGFGAGSRQCLGADQARLMFEVVVGEVLRRMPDYQVDLAKVQGYDSIAIINGLVSLPATFTPGPRLGAQG